MRNVTRTVLSVFVASALAFVAGCTKSSGGDATSGPKIGLVTDVGGRGDQSFNDSALRGLENWAADREYTSGGYKKLTESKRAESIPSDLVSKNIVPLEITPVVLHAKQQEDYESNLQLLIDDGAQLAIGVGFMLENAVETAARKNPQSKFLLVDSPILNASGEPYQLSNVSSVTFREQEGSFLVGAIAGLLAQESGGKVGFVGGMQLPLIRRFEVGFRAGVQAVSPQTAKEMLVAYTGSFNRVDAGKQVAQDLFAKGAVVVFHAAGADGLGVISAAKEAGKYAIGCDSDQYDSAPDNVLTSLIKRVDLVVYQGIADLKAGKFTSGNVEIGLAEGGLGFAPIRTAKIADDQKAEILKKVSHLEALVASGKVKVPANLKELAQFTFVADFSDSAAPSVDQQSAAPASPAPDAAQVAGEAQDTAPVAP